MKLSSGFRRLPLFWKLLVPYVGLLVIVGVVGAFLITRDLSSRAQATLNEQLLQASLRARAHLQQAELSLLESANFAANLEGMSEAIRARDEASTARLLRSVLALKDELSQVVVTDARGAAFVGYARAQAAGPPVRRTPANWHEVGFVRTTLSDPAGEKKAALLRLDGEHVLAIAAPVCSQAEPCDAVGAAVVSVRLHGLATSAAGHTESGGLRILDPSGAVLASTGAVSDGPDGVRIEGDRTVRRTESVGGEQASTLYAPLGVQGRVVGMLAVTLPAEPAFASVRGAAVRLVAILIAALAGVIGVGALLSRFIVRQTRHLLATNRALGQGDLTARAPVVCDDEIGELARGLNQMAGQLQASYETLESRVEQRTEEVQRLLRERTEFFASLSHELRTPIALIISHGEMLLDPDFRTSQRRIEERGEVIRDTGKQLLAVVNDILDLARLEAGSVRVDIIDVSLAAILADLRAMINGLASAAGVRTQIDLPTDLPLVRADPIRLREILVNLIDNAVKYTPRGGSMRIGAFHNEGWVSVAVSDTGVGIPRGAQEHVFEPFFRVESAETQHGQFSTGLGLAIAKKLAEAQSGEVSLESEPGRGSTFTVRLPATGSSLVALDPVRRTAGRRARRERAGDRRGQARSRVS